MDAILLLSQAVPRLWNRVRGIRNCDPGGFIVCHTKRFMFVPIAKIGSTTLKRYTLNSDFRLNEKHVSETRKVHQRLGFLHDGKHRIPLRYARQSQYESFTKLAVYRDPVERFMSLYKQKIKSPPEDAYNYFHKCKIIHADLNTFIAFAEKELERSEPLYQDEHLRPQHCWYAREDVDYVVPLERLDAFMQDELGCRDFHTRMNPSPQVSVSLDMYQEERIRELYARDYAIQCNY